MVFGNLLIRFRVGSRSCQPSLKAGLRSIDPKPEIIFPRMLPPPAPCIQDLYSSRICKNSFVINDRRNENVRI